MPATAAPQPAVFIGHGAPSNAIASNRYTQAWRAYFARHRPRAVVVVSAHWYVAGTRVTASPQPRTVHDFVSFKGGALHEFRYPAPGDVALAERVRDLLAPQPVALDERWGYDHGAWVVLPHAFPDADVPVIEVSLDRTQPPAFHHALGRTLGALRDEGVMIVGSGNIIHNLEIARTPWSDAPAGWAARFADDVQRRVDRGDHDALVAYDRLGPDAQLAVPTPDHYLPLLTILGAQRAGDTVVPIVAGVDDAFSVGMFSFAVQ
jgi:4,5-DOPA dioxygenase extradiol